MVLRKKLSRSKLLAFIALLEPCLIGLEACGSSQIGETTGMKDAHQLYNGYRFPPEIISHTVWLYYRFCMSLRDVEDLLAER